MAAMLAVGAILAAAGLPAAAATPPAREIGVPAAMRGDLRAAAVRYHTTAKVTGPLAGSVRAARYGPVRWAIATFSVPGPGLAGQPELLRRRDGERAWVDMGAVGPKLCGTPAAVLRAWDLQQRSRGCVAPRTPPPLSD